MLSLEVRDYFPLCDKNVSCALRRRQQKKKTVQMMAGNYKERSEETSDHLKK